MGCFIFKIIGALEMVSTAGVVVSFLAGIAALWRVTEHPAPAPVVHCECHCTPSGWAIPLWTAALGIAAAFAGGYQFAVRRRSVPAAPGKRGRLQLTG